MDSVHINNLTYSITPLSNNFINLIFPILQKVNKPTDSEQ